MRASIQLNFKPCPLAVNLLIRLTLWSLIREHFIYMTNAKSFIKGLSSPPPSSCCPSLLLLKSHFILLSPLPPPSKHLSFSLPSTLPSLLPYWLLTENFSFAFFASLGSGAVTALWSLPFQYHHYAEIYLFLIITWLRCLSLCSGTFPPEWTHCNFHATVVLLALYFRVERRYSTWWASAHPKILLGCHLTQQPCHPLRLSWHERQPALGIPGGKRWPCVHSQSVGISDWLLKPCWLDSVSPGHTYTLSSHVWQEATVTGKDAAGRACF